MAQTKLKVEFKQWPKPFLWIGMGFSLYWFILTGHVIIWPVGRVKVNRNHRRVVELADTPDLKSVERKLVRVRSPRRRPNLEG